MKFNVWKALKDSFSFYYKNFYQIIIIYLIYFIPNLLLSFLIKVNISNLSDFIQYKNIFYYLLILLIVNIIVYPISRISIYIYFLEKNIKESLLKSFKYYFGVLALYLFTSFIYLIFLLISSIISVIIYIIIKNFYLYIISFIILSILFMIITNKFFLSSPIFVFKENKIYESLKISWKNINIKESAKILIAQFIIYSIAIILIIYQQIFLFSFLKIVYILISSFLIIPIGNLFSIYIYKQYEES